MKSRAIALTFAVVSAAVGASDDSGVWSFRNGVSGQFPNTDPPTDWASDRNVVWRAPLSAKSNASPIIVGDKIFVLEEPSTLICLRKSDGAPLWRRTHTIEDMLGADSNSRPAPPRSDWLSTYGFTTPTPVSDGKRVWCVFGHGFVVCYDLDGKRLWSSELEVADKISGVAVSPCLIDHVLIVGGKGGERLCGFDAESGRKVWKTGEGAQEGSCVPVTLNGRQYVLASSGLLLDPRNGVILQRGLLGGTFKGESRRDPVNWGPTVVLDGKLAIFHVHFQPDQYNAAFRAVQLDPEKPQPKWEYYTNVDSNIRGRMGNSPLIHDGLLYAVKDGGVLEVFETQTGARVYIQQLPKHSYASLALAGGNIYAFGSSIVTIFKPGRTYSQVAQFKHGFHDFIASPVFESRRLYFRNAEALWCIENPRASAEPAAIATPAILLDDGPDLADTAKNAPLLPYFEWLLEYDQSRARLRLFCGVAEWLLAIGALGLSGWLLCRSEWKPGRGTILAMIVVLALTLPWLAHSDRVGNAFYPVAAWALAGPWLTLALAEKSGSARRGATRATSAKSRSATLGCGWLIGATAGLAAHYLPAQAVIIWYVLTGWQS